MLLANIVEGSPASQYLILTTGCIRTLPPGWIAVVLKECQPMFLVLTTLLRLFPTGRCRAGGTGPRSLRSAGYWSAGHLERGVLVAAGHDVRIRPAATWLTAPGALRVLDVAVIAGTLASWTAWLAIHY
jgi:hypothetical protein